MRGEGGEGAGLAQEERQRGLTFLFSPADRALACLFRWSLSSRAFATLTRTSSFNTQVNQNQDPGQSRTHREMMPGTSGPRRPLTAA